MGLVLTGSVLSLPTQSYAEERAAQQNAWTSQGVSALARAEKLADSRRDRARNVILFVGDGMGVSTITASRILEGQNKGNPGEENRLSFEEFPYLSLVKTYSVNQQTSDSAPTMTAMVTGAKTKDGILSINENVVRGDQTTVAGNELRTILELAEQEGLSTGVVSTARITHATPAACYAHSPDRDWESDAEVPAAASSAGAKDIARQLIETRFGDGLEVALGGGRSYFLPTTVNDPEDAGTTGRRKDGRNLTSEWASRARSAYVWNKAGFNAIDASRTDHLLGLFERSHMEYEADRAKDSAGEPSLSEMTSKAIDILSRNRKGFFLMVEGGRIDHAHHAGNASRALQDTIAMSDAIRTALSKVREQDTLVLVTADHSHTFTIAGYPARGNDILGKVVTLDAKGEPEETFAKDGNGLPYTTLSYANGPGYRAGVRPDLTSVDTAHVDFLQEATVPMSSETHAGEDVALYARGPSAHLVHGSQEQTISFYVMARALGLGAYRNGGQGR
ncbi:MAG: alkaline phosphatase, placental type [Pseudomonadota bacterium]